MATFQVENEKGVELSTVHDEVLDRKSTVIEAVEATHTEHNLTVWQAVKTYRRAALWSLLISTAVIMEGYDNHLLGSFIGYPAFREKYGHYLDEQHGYQISAQWQSGLSDIGSLGNIVGALLNGYLTPKFGPRKVLMASLAWLTCCIFITFFAPNMPCILVGQFLCSIPWGVAATTAPSYAAEVAPMALRGYLTTYINLCFCTGQLISAGVLKGLVNNPTQWGYRIPFATQWIWPVPLFIGTFFAPESPWYLIRKDKLEDCKKSLQRLTTPGSNVEHDATIALMIYTDRIEKAERAGVSYWDAFRGTNLRRTEIACVVYLAQMTCGAALAYSGTFFYEQTGISASNAFTIGLGGTVMSWLATLISWTYIAKVGRRTIFLCGLSFLCSVLLLIGILDCVPRSIGISWTQSILCLIWLAGYSASIGPIVFTIVAEIGSTRLRTQTVVLGRSAFYIGNIIAGVLEPYFMSPTAWDASGKTAFFWGGTAFLTAVWGFFRLPELKDRTYGEIDIMFQKGIPARKFAKYEINIEEELAPGIEGK